MPMRSRASMPSQTISVRRSPLPSRSAAAKRLCSSRSASMARLLHSIGFVRLGGENRQRRNVRVPFDERRHGAEAIDGGGIELPNLIAYRTVVRVDADLATLDETRAVPGEVHFLHCVSRQGLQVRERVKAVIDRAHV